MKAINGALGQGQARSDALDKTGARPYVKIVTPLVAAIGLVLFLLALAPEGSAAFPGGNGKIAFTKMAPTSNGRAADDVYAMNSDGSGLTNLTNLQLGTASPPGRLMATRSLSAATKLAIITRSIS